jgi:hypothetical protein
MKVVVDCDFEDVTVELEVGVVLRNLELVGDAAL